MDGYLTDLVELARSRAEPSVRLFPTRKIVTSPVPTPARTETILSVYLERVMAMRFGIEGGVRIAVDVSMDWLANPIARCQSETHRVTFEPEPLERSDQDTAVASVRGRQAAMQMETVLPWSSDLKRMGFALDGRESAALDDHILFGRAHSAPIHRLFGFAEPIQQDVFEAIEYDLARVGDVDPSSLRDHEYRLLCQVESDDSLDLLIGDVGRLYVLIPADDLPRLRSDRTLACVQCY